MRLRLSVVDPARAGATADLVVDAATGTTVAEIRTDALRAVGHAGGGLPPSIATLFAEPLFVDGAELPDDAELGVEPLLDGAVVSVGRAGGPAGRVRGTVGGFLELHTVGGPDAGQVHRLTPGEHRIGRASVGHGEAELVIDDPDMSRLHAELTVTPSGVTLRDLGSTNGTWVDGEQLGETAMTVTASTRVVVGSTTLAVRVPGEEPAAAHSGDGTVQVNRSPRIGPVAQPVSLHLPTPPAPRRAARFPLVAMLVPLLLAVPLALVLRSPYALLIGVFSPLMIVGNLVSDRITGRKDHQAAVADHEAEQEAVRAAADDAVRVEQLRRRASSPDAAEILQISTAVLQRIWERDPLDTDFLSLRVGSATLPSLVTVHDPAAPRGAVPEHPFVHDVPVTVPLAELGVVGLAGARPRVAALVRSLVGQLATLHSPRHLSLVVLALDSGSDWSWTAWLPHLAPGPGLGQGAEGLVGLGDDQVRCRVAELEALLDARLGERRGGGNVAGRRVVVLLDGAQRLRAVPGVARLLGLGPSVGIHLLCVDDNPGRLPVECRGTVVVAGEVWTRLRVSVADAEPVHDVVADLVPDRWAQRLARGLAPLRDATPSTGSGLPDTVRLLDELDVDATDASGLAARWRAVPRSTSVLLGATAGGTFGVDLLRDGPHALVAGTTGSGKSELLQTLIAGLAVANRPDELVFVLVDYKGGAAFAECARLPHTVGLVTDLDAGLTARALESLGAEIARRERLLAQHGATDLQDYQRRRDLAVEGARPPSLPRLVLVVDEFRVLAEELPDFISGLVRLAAVGRSLGVHLVLATQRPGGVVSADIKANVNLRVALRVQDASDSTDVVDTADAASISDRTPGRAVGRVGSGQPVLFQAARVGGASDLAAGAETVGAERIPPSVRRLAWATLGDPPPPTSHSAVGKGPTDLHRIVDAVSAASAELRIPPVASPWLAPLPGVLTIEDVPDGAGDDDTQIRRPGLVLEYGLLDDPARQRQVPAAWHLHADGHLAVVGTSRSGRTTTLRALLASLARQCAPADAWAYVLDGGGTLAPLAALPHVGAVVPRDDAERAGRLLRRLLAEVTHRQEIFSRMSVADLAEQRERASVSASGATETGSTDDPLPWIVLAVDSWESLLQQWDDTEGLRCVDALHQLLRQGAAVGVLCVVTGGRGVVTGQLGALVGHRLVLRMSDAGDAVMAGVPSRAVPSTWPPGRAVVVGGRHADQPRQVQVALLDADPSGAAQQSALESLAGARPVSHDGPFAVPPMPATVDLPPLLGAVSRSSAGPDGPLVLGVGGESVVPVGLDPDTHGRVHLVAGHPGSGRSTVLLVLAEAALHAGRAVVAVTPRPSPLSVLDGRHTVTVVDADGADRLEDALARWRAVGRPALVLVDDVESLDGRPVEAVLTRLVAEAAGSAPGSVSGTAPMVVGAGSTNEVLSRFQGLCVQLRRPGSGVVLGPAGPTDGDVLGVRLPRREVRHPGRGVLVHRGASTLLQVALPRPPAAYAGPQRNLDGEALARTADGRTHRP